MRTFTETQLDALFEIFNIGVGRAAASMSAMTGESVSLIVPTMDFCDARQIAGTLLKDSAEHICCVSQRYEGGLETEALLVFPEASSLELVREILKGTVPGESIHEMEQEAMSEIGNIVLNSCVSTFANILHVQFNASLPVFMRGLCTQVLDIPGYGDDDTVIALDISFTIEAKSIRGNMAFIFQLNSLDNFMQNIDDYFARMLAVPGGQ
ncbi:MAG: chemotaxis protein CheC [Methylococcaceae bacterium]|nr:MAG: chemotaxis protein CheC [Methylococcaceae bacterium]